MKELLDRINVQELAVIVICGLGLVLSILNDQKDLAMAIGGGLVGYLGGVNTEKIRGDRA